MRSVLTARLNGLANNAIISTSVVNNTVQAKAYSYGSRNEFNGRFLLFVDGNAPQNLIASPFPELCLNYRFERFTYIYCWKGLVVSHQMTSCLYRFYLRLNNITKQRADVTSLIRNTNVILTVTR